MPKFPTPKYKLGEDDENVYPPSEDTFLLMDALEKEQDLIINLRPSLSLEVGSGSGVVSAFLHQILSRESTSQATTSSSYDLFSICTDLNENALKCTRETAQMNSLRPELIGLVHCDILDPLLSRIRNSADIILMNPPYIPTEENARNEQELSYAGGARGRHLVDKLLPKIAGLLSAKGFFYLVAVKENGVDDLLSEETGKKHGLTANVVLERRCRNEHLFILKFTRNASESESKKPQQRVATPTASSSKITVHLKPVGAAPQLKKEFSKFKVDANSTAFQLQQTLRKFLGIKSSDSLFLFVKQAFSPSPEHTIGVLSQCFGSEGGILFVQYSLTPAWG